MNYNRQHPKSAGLSVLDSAANRGNGVSQASSDYGPRVKILANMQVHRGGSAPSRIMDKMYRGNIPANLPSHAHDHFRKYNKSTKSGIASHKTVYGGGGGG